MNNLNEEYRKRQKDPVHLLLGGFVFLVSLIVYMMTVQRTLSFWDCGEFITCAHLLGVPHPPGTPLFVLIGRIFSFFPIGDDPSIRINIISGISSAFAAMFGYFTATWLIRKWFITESLDGWRKVAVYLGGLVGGFMFAFSRTNWGNSVEAEVYGTSMLFMMVTIYLMLLWVDHRKEPRGELYLILMAYLSTLALGVHMTSFIIVPAAFLLIILVDERYRRSWQIWMTYIVLMIVAYEVRPFLIASAAWATIACCAYYWKRISQAWIFTLALPLLVTILFVAQGQPFVPVFVLSFWGWSLLTLIIYRLQPSGMFWRISFLVIMMAMLGFSVQLFIPIRSAQDPVMNMNKPDNWNAFLSFLERKQYGSEDMISRALKSRRGLWKNQFGTHPRMGFWGFFSDQYGLNGRRFLILFFLGMYGLYYTTKKHWKSGLFVFLIVLAGTVGLVIYMNFADGTFENKLLGEGHLEVRDRDYFWTPGFVMFGLMIGLGVAAFFDMIRLILAEKRVSKTLRNIVLSLCSVSVLLPSFALARNYFVNDRSRNFIPYDYAWNILQSARPNAVLFTNGDNDTFPVWCLQYVYGIRPDVKIANLSLINTNWYIKQLKANLNVPMSYSDDEIDRLVHRRLQDGTIYRVQDQMIANIIDQNNRNSRKIPIEFAITVSTSNKNYKKRSLDPYLQMEGMALRSTYPEPEPNAIDVEKTKDFYLNKFKFRGVTDSTIYKDENAARLVNNYISGFMFIADTLQRAGKIDEAAEILYKGIESVGGGAEPWTYLARMYALHGRLEDAKRVVEEAPDNVPREPMKLFIASALKQNGQKKEARKYLEETYAEYPDSRDAFNELFRFYYDEKMQVEMAHLLEEYIGKHPEDKQLVDAFNQLKREAPGLFEQAPHVETQPPESTEKDTGRRVKVVGLDSTGQGADSDTGQ